MKDRPHLRIAPESVTSRDTDFDGGGHTYRRSDYYTHGHTLIQGLRSVQQRTKVTQDYVKDRAFIEIRLAPGEKLKDRYKNLVNNSQIIVSDVINESTGLGYIKTDDIAVLSSRLKEYAETEEHTGKSYFSFVEEIRNIDSEFKLTPRLRKLIEEKPEESLFLTVESFSSLPRDAQEHGFLNQIQNELVPTIGRVISSYVHSSGTVVVELEVVAQSVRQLVDKFDSIRTIDLTPKLFLPKTQSLGNNISNLSIRPLEGDAKVCIFDSGTVTGNQFFDPFVIDRVNALVSNNYDTYHGNFVASRVIYRENVQDQLVSGELTPFAKVLDIRVFGTDQNGDSVGMSESQLITTIRQTVYDYHKEIKVYNLSLGFVDPYTDATTLSDVQVSRIAAELDSLSKEKDVLFVISAGNINSLYQKLQSVSYPDHFSDDATRILPPGEAFLGLTVGSIVTRVENGALGELEHPSPFSRRGPGSFGTLKPDVVVDGGNVTVTGISDQRIAAVALGENQGDLAFDVGTSFSAPLVSSYAAELFDRIPEASANLVKAMLLHFSQHPNGINTFGRNNKFEHIGFGVPNLGLCLESLKSKTTYVFEGSVPQQTYVSIPFWVPTILSSDTTRQGRKKARVRITLVWNPITDRRKQSEYSLTHLNLNLFKIDEFGQEKEVKIPLSQLLETSYKKKFYPVIRIEKEFERNFAGGLWSVQLRLSHRWDVPEEYEQEFAILISVEDPQDQLDVYGEINNEVGLRYQPLVRVR